MSLITCCPNCRTLFKVVADQLKVSDGWVRCGHCDGVFDASAHFQTNAETGLPAGPETEVPAVPEPAPKLSVTEESIVVTESVSVPLLSDFPIQAAPHFARLSAGDDATVSAPLSSYLSAPEAADFPAQDDPVRRQGDAGGPALSGLKSPNKRLHSAKSDDARRQHPPEVAFVQTAPRRDRSKKPFYKALGVLASVVLFVTLASQLLLYERDSLAARYPNLLPVLEVVCEKMDCQINPPRVIEAVMIDSSSFTQTGPDSYQLNVVLKNTRTSVVAMPALEVTLTNLQNDVLVRKILLPSDLGAASNRLEHAVPFAGSFNLWVNLPRTLINPLPADAASSDGQLAVEAASASTPVAGYRLFAFYP